MALISISSGVSSSGLVIGQSGSLSAIQYDTAIVNGIVTSTSLNSSGTMTVASGGIADLTVINGGAQVVNWGGRVSGTVIGDAGTQTILYSGLADGTQISSGGKQYTYGLATNTVVAADTAQQIVDSGGVASGTVLTSGGQMVIRKNSIGANAVINGTGKISVASAGWLSGTLTFTGNGSGTLTILDQAVDVSNTVISGFSTDDAIDLASMSYVNSASVIQTSRAGLVKVVAGTSSTYFNFASNSFAGQVLLAQNDGAGGTQIYTASGIHPFTDAITLYGYADETRVTAQFSLNPSFVGTYANLGTGDLSADGKTYIVSGLATDVSSALTNLAFLPTVGGTAPASISLVLKNETAPVYVKLNTALPQYLAGGAGKDTITGGAGADTLASGSGGGYLYASGQGDILLGGRGATFFEDGAGYTTIFGGKGQDSILASANHNLLMTGHGGTAVSMSGQENSLWSNGSDTIFAYAGVNTVIGAGDGARFFTAQGKSSPVFISMGGSNTIAGADGASTMFGTAGSLTYAGNSSGSALVLLGSGSKAELYSGNAGTMLAFGQSGATLTYFGGNGSRDTIQGGSGNITVQGGTNGTYFGGSAGSNVIDVTRNSTVFGGGDGDILRSHGAGNVLQAGSGNTTLSGYWASGTVMFAGTGNALMAGSVGMNAVDIFAFTNGRGGGSDTISGFVKGVDRLVFNGFSEQQVNTAYMTMRPDADGNVHFTLPDNTHITLEDVPFLFRSEFG
ncbi:adhesin [Granulibacter bethesdensis]|nr:adhesin [Granulibacter bethesdensis]